MSRFQEAINELQKAKAVFEQEGLGDFSLSVEKVILAMQGYGSLYPPHRDRVSSLSRLLWENGVRDSNAETYLDNAYECFDDSI